MAFAIYVRRQVRLEFQAYSKRNKKDQEVSHLWIFTLFVNYGRFSCPFLFTFSAEFAPLMARTLRAFSNIHLP